MIKYHKDEEDVDAMEYIATQAVFFLAAVGAVAICLAAVMLVGYLWGLK